MVMKCPLCGIYMVKIANNVWSCKSERCDNYFHYDKNERVFINCKPYKENVKQDLNLSNNIEDEYVEDYDSFLFFSNQKDYITRYEYRKSTNFIEDYLFENNKPANFDMFLEDDEIPNKNRITSKYELIHKGKYLEDINSKDAFDYYLKILENDYERYFKNDYYLYKKLVKLANDYEIQLDFIIKFFNSGIYCNRNHYLWFLKKLNQVCKHIDVPQDTIEEIFENFKNNGFNNKYLEDSSIFLAERLKSENGTIKVLSEKHYAFKQFRYELEEEISQLYYNKQYKFITGILEKLILDYNFKSTKLYERICANFHRQKAYDEEIKWIYRYITTANRYKIKDDWCKLRLDNLDVDLNIFQNKYLFFDNNEYYLDENDFENNPSEDYEIHPYLILVKDKSRKIQSGLNREKNPERAIKYYNSLMDNELFKNDYYLYKVLVILYEKVKDYENEFKTIISFFESGIYCDRFNYLFFVYHLKKFNHKKGIGNDDVDYYLKYFKEHGFRNNNLENNPVPSADRLDWINKKNGLSGKDFSNRQYIASLNLELDFYRQNSMLNHVAETYKKLLENKHKYPIEIYKKLCCTYHEMKDYENELKTIEEFFDFVNPMDYDSKGWFSRRLRILKKVMEENPNDLIIEDPEIEILFENHENYLTYDDFKSNEITDTELLDKLRTKQVIREQGLKLEEDYEKAIEYYNSFLDSNLFKKDYYIYRRLVMVYSNFGEYEMVYRTIKAFFNSGIYCNRHQYLWFLEKLSYVSHVKYISDNEISDMLCAFKENGFKNTNFKDDSEIIMERLKRIGSSLMIIPPEEYKNLQKEFELKEEITQLEFNGHFDKSEKVLKKLIDRRDYNRPTDYMKLCRSCRESKDYQSERELIEEYLSNNDFSKEWFENRLKELDKLI